MRAVCCSTPVRDRRGGATHVFDSRGGTLQTEKSAVSLRVPPAAIPHGEWVVGGVGGEWAGWVGYGGGEEVCWVGHCVFSQNNRCRNVTK